MLLDQSKAFAGGLPMNPDGTPNYSAIMKTLAEKGDINAVGSLAPILQQQQNLQGANAPDSFFGGGGGTGKGGYADPGTPAPGPWSGNPFLSTTVAAESEGDNSAVGDKGTAKGDWQFHDATWQKYAKNVPGASQYASAADAPPEVQTAVAETGPDKRMGPSHQSNLARQVWRLRREPTDRPIAVEFGGAGNGGGSSVEVASLDPSDVTAYANPDTPAVPPVSAAAGSTIPRADGGDSTPKGAVGGAHAGAAPQQWAQNGPAWAGINGALPVGPAAAPAAPGPAARPAQAPAAPGQASVASLVSGMVSDPQMGVRVAGNVARALKVDPAAPLTPEQALKAQLYVRNYAARAAQQPAASPSPQAASGIPGQPPAGGPITSLPPLPKGYTDPQQAILALRRDAARLSRFGPAANGRINYLEQWANSIEKSSAPMRVGAAETYIDPRTRQVLYQGPYAQIGRESGQTLDADAERYLVTGTLPPNMGRGQQGAAQATMIRERATELAIAKGIDPANLPQLQQSFKAQAASKGLIEKRTASLDLAENEASSLIPRVRDASKAVNRSQYPSLNKIIEMAQEGTGGQAIVRFGVAVESLAQTYARVLNPTGAPTAADKANAHEILDKAWSDGQIDAALDQMTQEINAAKQSLAKTRADMKMTPLDDEGGGTKQGGGAHPPGNYNYDPATGNLEPVK